VRLVSPRTDGRRKGLRVASGVRLDRRPIAHPDRDRDRWLAIGAKLPCAPRAPTVSLGHVKSAASLVDTMSRSWSAADAGSRLRLGIGAASTAGGPFDLDCGPCTLTG
jgi:hypothetical protein